MRPSASTSWIVQSLRALDWVQQEGLTLVSSVGLCPWEVLCAAASLRRIPQILLLPVMPGERFVDLADRVRADFRLGPEPEVRPVATGRNRAESLRARDEAVLALADALIPVALRPTGFFASRVQELRAGKQVIDRFESAYEGTGGPLKYRIGAEDLSPGLAELPQRYVIHWTRGAQGAWPDERPYDYYQSLLSSPTFPRGALETLAHILGTGRLIGSSRHLPQGVEAVAFSGLLPRDVIPLMRWRSRYREMSFEPYGVGIEARIAREIGIEPVVYYDPERGEAPAPETRWRSQSVGRRSDWRCEEEYRHRGDIDLGALPRDRILAFCLQPSEAGRLVRATGIDCMALLAHDSPVGFPGVTAR